MKKSFLCFLLFFSSQVSARVFDMGKETFGTYLRTTYATWGSGKSTFENSSGSATTSFDEGWTTTSSYEFGFLYSGRAMTWKFGFEILQQPKLKDNHGSTNAGVQHYAFDNEMSVITPKIGIEIPLYRWKESRLFVGVDYGMANLTYQNTYAFTTDGTTQYSKANYREEIKAVGSQITSMVGFETLMSDTTTFCFDLGYRMLSLSSLNHNVDADTLSQGAVVKGDAAKLNDGTARSLDLSGIFASAWFRIWIF